MTIDEVFRKLVESMDDVKPVEMRLANNTWLPKSYVHCISGSRVALGTKDGEYHAWVTMSQITELEFLP